ncbi:hypothetical protein [Actinomycetospora sp. TBRC 11914]|uniref:hypothetical protein n=1 Tax=Actinomycetospora sp. TBRC 11914 TaxID=2729387 RepID=UPI001B7D4C1B|nr:hypothetical protein [Actinomycetospora sp. TBRC 11914]
MTTVDPPASPTHLPTDPDPDPDPTPRPDTADGPRDLVVGLLADPGLASDLVARVATELPAALDGAISGYRWQVETARGPVGLDSEGLLPMLRHGGALRRRHGWDVVVLVTDLPRRAGAQPLVSDYGSDEGVGLVSLPALGAVSLRRRLRRAVVDLVADGLLAHRGTAPVPAPRRWSHPLSPPVARIASADEGIDAHLALQGTRGTIRLLGGLVRANRPWRLVPSLSPALTAAAAGAAFGVFYSNIWDLSAALSPVRLGVVAVLAVVAMAVWLIVDNGLWERPAAREHREEATLFNAATAATIGLGVACMAVLLIVLTTAAAAVVIPLHLLPGGTDGATAAVAYLRLGVLAGAMGIVAGALGSKLTSADAVRQAAYSTREQQRRALIDDDEPNSQADEGGADGGAPDGPDDVSRATGHG